MIYFEYKLQSYKKILNYYLFHIYENMVKKVLLALRRVNKQMHIL